MFDGMIKLLDGFIKLLIMIYYGCDNVDAKELYIWHVGEE